LERAFVLREALGGFIEAAVQEQRQKRAEREGIEDGGSQVDQDNPDLIAADELTSKDWEDLKIIFEILQPFRRWTRELQLQGTGTGRVHANGYLQVARALLIMDDLLAHLEESKQRYSDTTVYSAHILSSLNHARAVFEK
jgi:hypothetical protein